MDSFPIRASVHQFSGLTADGSALATGRQTCKVTTGAMALTGVDWLPGFPMLATPGFEVRLVNTYDIKTVSVRKSDVLDCQ